MTTYQKNKFQIPFRLVTIVAVFTSVFFITLGAIRFFEINFFLKFLPETTREVLDKSPVWFYYVYIVTSITNLYAVTLLYKRSLLSIATSKYSAIGMIVLITYYFFTTEHIYLYVAIEMLITLMFYLLFAWFTTYARKKGELEKISKEKTTMALKIQEGCDHGCLYCSIPKRKGKSRSDTLTNILANAEYMAEEGVKDIVLVGDNVGDFGTGEKGNLKYLYSLLDLMKELDKVGDIHRFTLLSVVTPMFSDKTLNFIKNSKRFTPYFSVEMDSASATMLKKMKRPFSLEAYKDHFIRVKEFMPEAYIDVQIIVGFPGETDELFNETVEFLSTSNISYITPILYSDKVKVGAKSYGTIKGAVSRKLSKKRKAILKELSKKKLKTFYETQLGQERLVLFESRSKRGFIYGYTDNNVKVKLPWDPELGNSLHKIKLTGIDGSFMLFDFVKDGSFITHESFSKI